MRVLAPSVIFTVAIYWKISAALGSGICTNSMPSNKSLQECCTFPVLINGQVYEKCQAFLEVGLSPCLAECIINGTGFSHGSGMIDYLNLFRSFLNSVRGEVQWGDIIYDATKTCHNEVMFRFGHGVGILPGMTGEMNCNPISGFILSCMESEIFKRCPSLKADPECVSLQAYAKTCMITHKIGNYYIIASPESSRTDASESPLPNIVADPHSNQQQHGANQQLPDPHNNQQQQHGPVNNQQQQHGPVNNQQQQSHDPHNQKPPNKH